MTPIVFLDTETTSLRPDRWAWEVAMIRRDDDGERECRFFVALVDIGLQDADPFSLSVGRFWERHPHAQRLAGGGGPFAWQNGDSMWSLSGGRTAWEVPDGAVVDAADAAAIVAAWTHRAHLVGAVPAFDADVLSKLLRDNWLTPSWNYHLIDVEALAVGWLARKFEADAQSKAIPSGTAAQMRRTEFEPPWSSEMLSAELGVEPASEAERHTALGDARLVQRIYDRVMGYA